MSRIPPKGRLTLTIRSAEGEVLAVREAKNIVLKQGAELIAGLFSGTRNTPVDRVRIGFGTETLPATGNSLTQAAPPIDAANLEAALKPENFKVDNTSDEMITVRISAPFEPKIDIQDVSEAGLFAGGLLYNQVIFEPVDMTKGQVITFFWQVDFPFGR